MLRRVLSSLAVLVTVVLSLVIPVTASSAADTSTISPSTISTGTLSSGTLSAGTVKASAPARVATTGAATAVGFAPLETGSAGRAPSRYACTTEVNSAQAQLLPVNRWKDATGSFHSRLSSRAWNDIPERAQRSTVMSWGMSVGNLLYGWSTSAVTMANNFCALDAAGGRVDRAAAAIGNSLIGGPSTLLGAIVGISLITLVWKSRTTGLTGALLRGLMVKGLVAGLLVSMVAGAGQSTGGGAKNNDGPYNPGPGSPGWYAVTIDNAVSTFANAPVAGLYKQFVKSNNQAQGVATDPLSCAAYVDGLHTLYAQSYGNATSLSQSAATIPVIIDGVWVASGLEAYKQAQFGYSTKYSDRTYCRLLDWNADMPVLKADSDIDGNGTTDPWEDRSVESVLNAAKPGLGNMLSVKVKGENGDHPKSDVIVWNPQNATQRDVALVAWAACVPKSAGSITSKSGFDGARASKLVQPGGLDDDNLGDAAINGAINAAPGLRVLKQGWDALAGSSQSEDVKAFVKDKAGYSSDACYQAFNVPEYDGADFNWGNQGDVIIRQTSDPGQGQERNFLLSLHGNSNGSGIIAVIIYVLAALGMLLVFGVISGAILIAKLAATLALIMVIFVLIRVLAGASLEPLAKFGKWYVGMSLFSLGGIAILAVVAILTRILYDLGAAMGGAGSTTAILWSGFSPLLAVYVLHYLFSKVMRIPSPFKLSSGLAYGAAAGAMGGAAFSGLDRFSSGLGARGVGGLRGFGKQAAASALGNRFGNRDNGAGPNGEPGSAGGRRGQMTPRRDGADIDPTLAGGVAGDLAADGVSTGGVPDPTGAVAAAGAPLTGAERRAARVSAAVGRRVEAGDPGTAGPFAATRARLDNLTSGGAVAAAAGAATRAGANMWSNVKQRPVRTIGKYAAVGGLGVLTGGTGLAVMGGGVAAWKAAHYVRPKNVRARNEQAANAWRQQRIRQAEAEARAAQAVSDREAEIVTAMRQIEIHQIASERYAAKNGGNAAPTQGVAPVGADGGNAPKSDLG